MNAKRVARRGRPVGDHHAKRSDLLKAAMSVIAEEGYAGTSLRKVALRAGGTTGAVTYYFANKEAMISAIAEKLWDEFDALLERANDDHIDLRTLLEEFLAQVHGEEIWLVTFEMLAHARHESAFAGILQRRYAQYRDVLTRILAKGQKQGQIRSDIAATLLADHISAMSDGWMMMAPVEPERFKPRRIKALLDAVITLVGPQA